MTGRKLLGLVAVGVVLGLVSAVPSFAALMVGDTITLTGASGRPGPGGAFQVTGPSTLFYTFCLETDEFISLPGSYTVSDISINAIRGGSGGPDPDPISYQTQYLYFKYARGDYGAPGSTQLQTDFQQAIWFLEGETLGVSNYLVTDANSNAIDMDYGVRVMNLVVLGTLPENYGNVSVQKQSMLIFVPEPGTMILLGSGLLGLVVAGRKKFRM